jgi:hypothetical protein
MLTDPELAADIDVIGVHYPLVDGKLTTTDAARRTGKPLWSSEDQPNGGGGPFLSRDWPVGGRILAHLYNRNYLEGTFTSTEIWSPITSYYYCVIKSQRRKKDNREVAGAEPSQ